VNDLRDQVLKEVDYLEKVQADLAAISKRTDDERLRELIHLRRRLSEQIARVGKIAERYFEESGAPDRVQLFRTHFTNMRSKAATHQANWPAVRLNAADEQYQQSSRAVREANRAFVAWIRGALK
jgi:hypothetical protein